MARTCDLHTHSVFSDGTCTPEEIIDKAEEIGLSAVALCDHNSVDGVPRFLEAARGRAVEAVSGAEFSVFYEGEELHLLGLDIPSFAFSQLTEMMQESKRLKEQSNLDMLSSFARIGVVLDYQEIKAKHPDGIINRSHIAAELIEKGYVPSKAAAFETLLSPDGGHYKEPARKDFWEMLAYLCEIGAIPVLAHPLFEIEKPKRAQKVQKIVQLLPKAKARGLVGMECYYSEYSPETTELALRLAKESGLKPSGGSDFHGTGKEGIHLGVGRGDLNIPYEWLTELRNR